MDVSIGFKGLIQEVYFTKPLVSSPVLSTEVIIFQQQPGSKKLELS
jgi:hypothetical protein